MAKIAKFFKRRDGLPPYRSVQKLHLTAPRRCDYEVGQNPELAR